MEGRFASGHLYDGAAQRPDISRGPIPPGALVYDLWSHVLESTWRGEERRWGGQGGEGQADRSVRGEKRMTQKGEREREKKGERKKEREAERGGDGEQSPHMRGEMRTCAYTLT